MSKLSNQSHPWRRFANHGHCGLCGNHGYVDTRGVRTAAGVEVGDLFWCICPNGEEFREQVGGQGPTQQWVNRRESMIRERFPS